MPATAVSERPILFSGPMVRAILEGRKSATRRVVRPEPLGIEPTLEPSGKWVWWRVENDRNVWDERRCPFGEPGDLLWVRETFIHVPATYVGEASYTHPAVPEVTHYRADEGDRQPGPWTPSIFMPKHLARLWLRVTDVGVERLHEITHDDALAEGLDLSDARVSWEVREQGARVPFARGWDALNARRGFSWARNPWVWVVRFERTENEP